MQPALNQGELSREKKEKSKFHRKERKERKGKAEKFKRKASFTAESAEGAEKSKGKTEKNKLVLAGGLAIIHPMSERRNEQPHTPADHAGALTAALIMSMIGWGGLYLLVTTTLPTAFPRWLFFVLLYLAVTGTVLPFVRFLNVRFNRADAPPLAGGVILRESVWIGLFVVACAWLQIPRVLNPIIAFFLALGLTIIEVFLRLNERGVIKPEN